MNVVYVVQETPDGAVTIGTSTDRGVSRRLTSLQAGNPRILSVVDLLDGDERLERQLHVRWADHRIRGDWYRHDVLGDLPDVARVARDTGDETRRLAAAQLADLAPKT